MKPLWAIGCALIALTLLLTLLANAGFDAPILRLDPVVVAVALMVGSGVVWLALPPALRAAPDGTATLWVVLAVGLAMRLIFFGSDPIFENDYHRYLWDGAAVNDGLNPYAASPFDAISGAASEGWRALAEAHPDEAASVTYDRLRTIYPPVAQAAFALSDALEPFSVTALRLVFLAFELVALALLAALLRETGRPLAWLAIYWWNPLVAKELASSVHMEAVLLPFLLAALLFAARRYWLLAASGVALAAGAKLWPLYLGALALRGAGWRMFFLGAALIGAAVAAMAVPILLGRLDGGSGFVAYAQVWERNSALFPLVVVAADGVLAALRLDEVDPGAAARLAVALGIAALAALIALRPIAGARDLCRRALIVIAALFLLSPTGYPWYSVWFAPLLAMLPWAGLRILMVLLPLYALRFLYVEQGDTRFFDDWIVWIQFGPALALLGWEALRRPPNHEPAAPSGALKA